MQVSSDFSIEKEEEEPFLSQAVHEIHASYFILFFRCVGVFLLSFLFLLLMLSM